MFAESRMTPSKSKIITLGGCGSTVAAVFSLCVFKKGNPIQNIHVIRGGAKLKAEGSITVSIKTPGPCPLYPRKRTLVERARMSGLCHKRTSAILVPTGQGPRHEARGDVNEGGDRSDQCHLKANCPPTMMR